MSATCAILAQGYLEAKRNRMHHLLSTTPPRAHVHQQPNSSNNGAPVSMGSNHSSPGFTVSNIVAHRPYGLTPVGGREGLLAAALAPPPTSSSGRQQPPHANTHHHHHNHHHNHHPSPPGLLAVDQIRHVPYYTLHSCLGVNLCLSVQVGRHSCGRGCRRCVMLPARAC